MTGSCHGSLGEHSPQMTEVPLGERFCLSAIKLESFVSSCFEFETYGLLNVLMSRLGRVTRAQNRVLNVSHRMSHEREIQPREERLNAYSSGTASILSMVGLILVWMDFASGPTLHLIAGLIFASSMIVLYACSALNHGLSVGPAKEFFFKADLATIYLLIAGSYTPVLLVGLGEQRGIWLTVAIWTLAVIGTVRILRSKMVFSDDVDRLTLVSYLVMGWFLLVAPMDIYSALSGSALMWLAIGEGFIRGASYSFVGIR